MCHFQRIHDIISIGIVLWLWEHIGTYISGECCLMQWKHWIRGHFRYGSSGNIDFRACCQQFSALFDKFELHCFVSSGQLFVDFRSVPVYTAKKFMSMPVLQTTTGIDGILRDHSRTLSSTSSNQLEFKKKTKQEFMALKSIASL